METTLRALGILVALFQGNNDPKKRVLLVGVEEPEIALHHGSGRGVARCERYLYRTRGVARLRDAADKTQIIVTSHSPDLLDDKDLDPGSILAVEARDGTTIIAGIDEAGKSALRDRLYTTGELLRLNQLQPDSVSVDAEKVKFAMKADDQFTETTTFTQLKC